MTRQRPPVLLPLIALLVGYGVWRWLAAHIVLAPSSEAHRVGLACAALLPVAALLLVMIVVQMAVRGLTGALDPTAGGDGRFLLTNQRVISNTVEQLAAFVPSLLALAAGAAPDEMRPVVALALVFALARLVFWGGYLLDPRLRSPGMAVTLAANAATLAAAARVWLR